MKKLLFILTLIFSSFLYANPAPFGLEINKTTLKQVEEKYNLIENGTNYYSKGAMYYINTDDLSLDGLKSVLLIFSEKDELLLAVIAQFNRNKFDSLNKNLSGKYKLVKKEIPFVGNKYVKYKDDQSFIELSSPHMSFDLEVTYILMDFDALVKKIQKADKEQKNKDEFNSL